MDLDDTIPFLPSSSGITTLLISAQRVGVQVGFTAVAFGLARENAGRRNGRDHIATQDITTGRA